MITNDTIAYFKTILDIISRLSNGTIQKEFMKELDFLVVP